MQKQFNIDIDYVNAELAKRKFRNFVSYDAPNYIEKEFNIYLMERLHQFALGNIKKLILCLPPQHGKSELSTRNLPAYILGLFPQKKIAITSYSATVAKAFAKDVKNKMQKHEYSLCFPNTKIGKVASKENNLNLSDTSYLFETNQGGYIYGVGRGGPLTSKTVDINILDDPLKDRAEATSLVIKDGLEKWYTDVVRTRLHNGSQELISLTRWVEDDIVGRLMKHEKDWEVIVFPVIKTADYSEYDTRNEGEVLFPEKHSLERMLKIKEQNEITFNSLYQQDPKPSSHILVHKFTKVHEFPEVINKWIIGIDYGWNDPTVVVAIGCVENQRYWKPLLYKPGKEIVEEYKGRPEKTQSDDTNNIVVDAIHAAIVTNGYSKSLCFSEHDPYKINHLRKKGLLVYLADKSVAKGIEKVNEFDNFYLDSDYLTYNEVSTYQFKAIGDLILDQPMDGNDHIMNSGRYAIYTDALMNR